MATSFNDLPQELCNDIVRFFKYDRKTLFQLCLTSVRFVDEAQSYLYAQLTRNTTPSNSARYSKLLTTLTVHNPSLGKYVKAFGYDISLQKDDPMYEGLRRALRLMINVTWLEINTWIPHSPQAFFDGCTFQLKHFRCRFASSDRTAIYKMLSTQPSLQSLYVDRFNRDFPSNCCLNLNRLCVEDWRSLVLILPGRSIVALELLRVQELLQIEPFFGPVPPSITNQLGNLTHLTFQSDTPYDFLRIVAPYLTSLMILRIIGKDDENMNRTNVVGEPEVLCKLSNFKIFVWSLDVSCGCHTITEEEADELYYMLWNPVELWFEDMPKLEAVYTLKFDWQDPDNEEYYSLWIKDMSPRTVDAKVALGRKSFYTW